MYYQIYLISSWIKVFYPTWISNTHYRVTSRLAKSLWKIWNKFFGAPRMPPTPLREVFAKFSRKFFENVGAKNFSKSRSRRRDQFGPKIVKIRAILTICEPFEVFGCQKNRISGWKTTTHEWKTTTWGVEDNNLWTRTGFRPELGKGREGET